MAASLRICTLSDQAFDWFTRYTGAIARGDAAAFEHFLHPDAVFQINNHMPVYGRSTVALAMARFRAAVEGMRYEFLNIYGEDFHFAAEVLHHYVRKDGMAIVVPAGAFIERDPATGALMSARAHLDLTELFA